MKRIFLASLSVILATPATAQSRDDAQLAIARHAISGAIVLDNRAASGSWLMVRPVTGVIQARGCVTDFAAPRTTQLSGVQAAANHMYVDWSEVSTVTDVSGGIRFTAAWVGAGNLAELRVANQAARTELASAIRALARSCNPNFATSSSGSTVPLARPGQ